MDSRNSLGVKEVLERGSREYEKITDEFFGRLIAITVAAFGLITALAWDDVLRELFGRFFGGGSSLSLRLLYAALLTILTALVSFYLGRKFMRRTKAFQRITIVC